LVSYTTEAHEISVTENRVLRRIFRPNREEVSGGRRRLHNEEYHYLYALTNFISVIEARRIRWAGHVGCMGR